MTSTLLEQYDHALAELDARIALIGDDQWSNPTPCRDWDVRALVAHMVDEVHWVPYLLEGGSVAESGRPVHAATPWATTPKAAWREGSRGRPRGVPRPRARSTARCRCPTARPARATTSGQMTVDATVHAWDLARGIGADDQLDPELVRRIHDETEKDTESLAASGLFDPPISVAGARRPADPDAGAVRPPRLARLSSGVAGAPGRGSAVSGHRQATSEPPRRPDDGSAEARAPLPQLTVGRDDEHRLRRCAPPRATISSSPEPARPPPRRRRRGRRRPPAALPPRRRRRRRGHQCRSGARASSSGSSLSGNPVAASRGRVGDQPPCGTGPVAPPSVGT